MYQTLYRKYRPKKFGDIVGQNVIVKTLKNSIANDRISHAYLFIGPRGTGKTSTAKIFSRAVNCLNFKDDICEDCEMCKASEDNECMDIIEIDAASNNGVDEIRTLREKVTLVPSKLKYKVYIIDEVHMLTIQAFNALLKTLEEPPKHIIFILATTDPQKIPETIISRCQCFNFSRIGESEIVNNLSSVSKEEKITVDEEVLKQIAVVSDGGMRDSLGMLDKLISYSDKITVSDFLQLNGLVTNNDLKILLDNISENKIIEVINLLEEWNKKGKDLIQIMIQLLNYLKEEIISEYINLIKKIDLKMYQNIANIINEKLYDIKKSSNPRIYIEIILLNFMNQYISEENEKIISREIISQPKSKFKVPIVEEIVSCETSEKNNISKDNKINNIEKLPSKKSVNILDSNIKTIMKIRMNNAFITATKEFLNEDKLRFNDLNDYTFDQKIGYLVCALLDGNLRLSSDKYIVISYEYESVVNSNLLNLVASEKVLLDLLKINKKIIIISDLEWENYAKEYVENRKQSKKYEYISEPELMFDISEKKTKKVNKDSVSTIFGDIVEVY